jgi:serine/threonine-protein kinase
MPQVGEAPIIERLRQSQLLGEGQLTELVAAGLPTWKPDEVASELLRRDLLTNYQVDHLLKNRLDKLELGAYRLLRPIGSGGMGEVYLALQKKLERNVAIKILRPDFAAAHVNALARFRREALAVAKLSHPNIVHIYDADELDGTHFIVMEYVPGIDFARLVAQRGPLPIDMACDLVRQAAEGLQHAHEAGLVHRDIKPSNLLVVLPEKAAPGHFGLVKILDLGLARLEEGGDLTMTRSRNVIGTPDFISPEQAQNASEVDIRADLYSLGCTFYFLLSGQVPFPNGTPIEKLMAHYLERPKSIILLRPEVPKDVQAILDRLLRKDPAERYATPAELVAALLAVSLPITASRPLLSSVLPAEIAAPAAVEPVVVPSDVPKPVAASAPAGDAPSLLQRTHLSQLLPPDWVPPGGNTPPVSKGATPLAPLNLGPLRVPAKTASTAQCRIVQAGPLPTLGVPQGVAALAAPRVAVLQGHTAPVSSLAFDPRGQYLATGGLDQSFRVWRVDDDDTRQDAGFQDPRLGEIFTVCFAPGGELLVSSGGLGGRVWVWNWKNSYDTSVRGLEHSGRSCALAASSDGEFVAAVDRGDVRLWSVSKDQFRAEHTLTGRGRDLTTVLFSDDGQLLFAGDAAGSILVWERRKRRFRQSAAFSAHGCAITAVAINSDGRRLATSGMDNTVRVWTNFDSVQRVFSVTAGLRGVARRLTFATRQQALYAVSDAGQVVCFDTHGVVLHDWRLSQLISSGQAIADDGRRVALARTDGSIGIYAIRPDAPLYQGGSSLEMAKPGRRARA